jgi:hypothetical protein
MKKIPLFLLSFLIMLSGCTLYEAVSDKITGKSDEMHIVDAGYNNWSTSSDKGTNLAIIVENWPEGATPSHIIYNKKKSLNANISTISDVGLIINARIVSASSSPRDRSDSVTLSDRLVYMSPDGKSAFIEINEWRRIEEQDEQ